MPGPKTRFAAYALENGLESAIHRFPGAFNDEEIAKLRELDAPLRSRLKELHAHWEKFDEALDD